MRGFVLFLFLLSGCFCSTKHRGEELDPEYHRAWNLRPTKTVRLVTSMLTEPGPLVSQEKVRHKKKRREKILGLNFIFPLKE